MATLNNAEIESVLVNDRICGNKDGNVEWHNGGSNYEPVTMDYGASADIVMKKNSSKVESSIKWSSILSDDDIDFIEQLHRDKNNGIRCTVVLTFKSGKKIIFRNAWLLSENTFSSGDGYEWMFVASPVTI